MGKKKAILFFLIFSMTAFAADAGVYSGKVKCVSKNLKEYCVNYSGEPLKGTVVIRSEDGKIQSIGNFRKGYRSGYSRFFDENGALERITHYKGGRKKGKERLYYPNGKIMLFGRYYQNLLSGKVILRNSEGKTSGVMFYKKGKLLRGYCLGADGERHPFSAERVKKQPFNTYAYCGGE